jgi:hypothetical protein
MTESTESLNRDDADELQGALDAVRRLREGQQISPEVFADTLARMRQAANAKPSSTQVFARRITTMTFRQRVAAASVIMLSGLTLWFSLANQRINLSSIVSLFGEVAYGDVSYADVASHIRALHTVSWTETASGGAVKQPISMKTLCIEPDLVRNEMPGGTTVNIMNRATSKSLLLIPAAKKAFLIHFEGKDPPSPMEDMEIYFQKLPDQPGQPIEDRQIGDIKAKGFRTKSFGLPISLWVDPKTKLPMLVEMSVSVGKEKVKVVLSDFVFDAPMDESLFSLQPPAGYTVSEMQLPNSQ